MTNSPTKSYTILTTPPSEEEKARQQKLDEDLHFAESISKRLIQDYKDGNLTKLKCLEYLENFTRVPIAKDDPRRGENNKLSFDKLFGSSVRQVLDAVPEPRNKKSRRSPTVIQELVIFSLEMAIKDDYVVNDASIENNPERSAFLKVSNLFRARGFDYPPSSIKSWYKKHSPYLKLK